MNGVLIIVLLGTSILILGLRMALQASSARAVSPAVTMEEFVNAREALDTAFVEAAAIQRIFSTDDMQFIAHAGSPKVQRLFLQERKTLAIQWLRKTQKQVSQLMRLHSRLAGLSREPRPALELRLGFKYAVFVLASYLVLALLWLRGPFKARRIVAYTSGVAGYFCTVFSLGLENANLSQLAVQDPTRDS